MDTDITTTENIPSAAAVMIQNTIDWFDERIAQLKTVSDGNETIIIAKNDGSEIELSEKQALAYRAGIHTAIEVIGQFPLSLDRISDEDDDNEGDNEPF